MDFIHDQLIDGRKFHLLKVIGDYRRERLVIEEGFSLPTVRVIRTLTQLLEWCEKPSVIRCDNGPEFISHEFVNWAAKLDIRVEYIQPGNPQQNAYVKRYNRTIRYSWFSKYLFYTLDEV